ncbi:TlpA family protein disulfide reductase [Tessaracoccus sp. OS52]|uniref:TlpA family protein disulfide reductase n=1 Tax=Tessaracoccus sp. OS52 TaxID=2886691 RepID=UPI001D105248|nr:TlpA disulfide reductase family protein [Tessaracoccus sp. OS52]MCC2594646.1 TlpA family protein disulfide reductase [Tessaracoccus sp. OS52]
MRRRSFLAGLTSLPLLAACAAPDGPGIDDDTIGFQAGDGSVVIVPAAEREPAPELRGETLDGEELSTADFAGQVMVLNVWGSWCAPCRAEAPHLVEAAAQLPEVAFIGINTRDLDPAPAKAFVRAFKVPYPNIYDPDGALLLKFGQLPPKAIPSTLVIDEQGRVAARMLGEITASTLTGVISDVRGAG